MNRSEMTTAAQARADLETALYEAALQDSYPAIDYLAAR